MSTPRNELILLHFNRVALNYDHLRFLAASSLSPAGMQDSEFLLGAMMETALATSGHLDTLITTLKRSKIVLNESGNSPAPPPAPSSNL